MEEEGKIRNVAVPTLKTEIAKCAVCGWRLRFGTGGDYGQSFEACTNPACVNRHPHAIVPDHSLLKPMTGQERAIEKRRLEKAAARAGLPDLRRTTRNS